jgi:hypothetical protein
MKTSLTFSLLFVVFAAVAQSKLELPRTEFYFDLSETSIAIKAGQSKQVVLSITRSKSFAKEKGMLGLQSTLPKGVSISYEPKEGIFETSVATISVASDAAAGIYQIVLSAMLSTKKKGEILKLTVNTDEVATK